MRDPSEPDDDGLADLVREIDRLDTLMAPY
jgi:hypothetical protein